MKKTLFITICLCLLLSVVSCKQKPQQVSDKELYDDIISQYTELLTAKYNGEELPKLDTKGMDKREAEIAKTLHGIVNSCRSAEGAYNMGYGYKDMDGNGTLELLLMTKSTFIQGIFTISDGKPILLEANNNSGDIIYFAPRNRFFMVRSSENGNIVENTFYTCRVDGDKMAYDSVYGRVRDAEKSKILELFQIVNGKRIIIDEQTYDELIREYDKANKLGYSDFKLSAPRIHLPLADNKTNKNLPVADFSSYSNILNTYKSISTCLDKFDTTEWTRGNYDNLFSFPDDVAFDYYNLLLYGSYCDHYYVGYDEIDLNGDGQDELILMNEDYRIKAIFTKKNGTPVMLAAFSNETCWLDDQGLIHVDKVEYNEVEHSLYEFTKNGDYNHIYSILLAKNGNRYLTKDGKTELITYEESMEIYYNDYFCYPEPFKAYEHTRNISGITYTPLTKTTEDLVKSGINQTWRKHANMERTTGKELSYSYTYANFENVTDTQMDVNFRYTFTYYYPDPDRDNYMLHNTTESFLKITAHAEDGVFVFNESGIKGRLEFGNMFLWIIIEESSDERFPVGAYCYSVYTDQG
ncbi:MAG: hypothetical protein E7593_00635 [Ruminococcaceae bacterium]|nr:hypothetical protein [Oscillospiraceae bacterium]